MIIKSVLRVLAISLLAASVNAEEIRMVTVDYPPYFGSSLPDEGPVAEIAAKAFKKVGYDLKVSYVPWARAMQDAKAGKSDGLLGAWYAKEREQWFVYSAPLPGNEVVLFKRKGASPASFTSYDELKPYKVGIVRGSRNPPGFDAAELKTEVANSDKLNLTKLAKERVDLILIDRGTAKHIISNELATYEGQLESIEPPLEVLPLYLLISKKIAGYEKKVDDFNRGLKMLQDEGGVQAILQKHGM